ncbi:hypothetical protein [Candidatus Palauibacter sp.]|uniref:HVO_A0114 family putative DNA-binding protein n=1 Tax=Candidatus Palauibacter sp. TaxID=3101350 RepID=UPI003B015EC9
MRTLKIGIADYDQMKARTLAIAHREHTPARGEPKVWFTSIESFAKLLSEHNRHLLELIARERPRSLTELVSLTGTSGGRHTADEGEGLRLAAPTHDG